MVTLNEKQVFELVKLICAKNGQDKIKSIQDIRDITGFDLRDAKDIIWALTPKNDDDLVSEVREVLDRKFRGF